MSKCALLPVQWQTGHKKMSYPHQVPDQCPADPHSYRQTHTKSQPATRVSIILFYKYFLTIRRDMRKWHFHDVPPAWHGPVFCDCITPGIEADTGDGAGHKH